MTTPAIIKYIPPGHFSSPRWQSKGNQNIGLKGILHVKLFQSHIHEEAVQQWKASVHQHNQQDSYKLHRGY